MTPKAGCPALSFALVLLDKHRTIARFFSQIQIPVWDFNGIVEMKIGYKADYSF